MAHAINQKDTQVRVGTGDRNRGMRGHTPRRIMRPEFCCYSRYAIIFRRYRQAACVVEIGPVVRAPYYPFDYRLSRCALTALGLKTESAVADQWSVDLMDERDVMQGRDDATPARAHVAADSFSAGGNRWF